MRLFFEVLFLLFNCFNIYFCQFSYHDHVEFMFLIILIILSHRPYRFLLVSCTYIFNIFSLLSLPFKCLQHFLFGYRWLVACRRQVVLTQGPAPDYRHNISSFSVPPSVPSTFRFSTFNALIIFSMTLCQIFFFYTPFLLPSFTFFTSSQFIFLSVEQCVG